MANSATRAQIQRHFTKLDNLGDLTGKAASLNTTASVVGTGLGVLLSTLFLAASSDVKLCAVELVSRCSLISFPLILVCLLANYQSCRLGISPRLSLQRLDIIFRSLLPCIYHNGRLDKEVISSLSRYIMEPTSVGAKERFLYWPWNKQTLARVSFDPAASIITKVLKSDHEISEHSALLNQSKFMAIYDQYGKLCIWFSDTASSEDIIYGLFTVYLAESILSTNSITWEMSVRKSLEMTKDTRTQLLDAFKSKGWELSQLDIDRKPIHIGPVKEHAQ